MCVCQSGFYGDKCEKGRAQTTRSDSSDDNSIQPVMTRLPPVQAIPTITSPPVQEGAANRRIVQDETIIGGVSGKFKSI